MASRGLGREPEACAAEVAGSLLRGVIVAFGACAASVPESCPFRQLPPVARAPRPAAAVAPAFLARNPKASAAASVTKPVAAAAPLPAPASAAVPRAPTAAAAAGHTAARAVPANPGRCRGVLLLPLPLLRARALRLLHQPQQPPQPVQLAVVVVHAGTQAAGLHHGGACRRERRRVERRVRNRKSRGDPRC